MRDLFKKEEPYHKELHEIMLKKKYSYQRKFDEFWKDSFDQYQKDGRTLIFWRDETIVMTEANGKESPLPIFMRETDNIFDPDQFLN